MKRPLRTFYSPLAIPQASSAASGGSFEYRVQDAKFPHDLKLVRLPSDPGDVGGAGILNQFEMALRLVRVAAPDQWLLKEVEFEQTGITQFVALRVHKDLGLKASAAPAAGADVEVSAAAASSSKFDTFDCPFFTPGQPEFTSKLRQLDQEFSQLREMDQPENFDFEDEFPKVASSIRSDATDERVPGVRRPASEAGTARSARQPREVATDKELLERVLGDRCGTAIVS